MRKLTFGISVIGGIVLILTAAAVGAFTIDSSTQRFAVVQERLTVDRGVVVTLQGNAVAGANRTGNGATCPGREASPTDPILRNDLFLDNLQYRMRIQEARATSWPPGRIYKVEVFDGGSLITTRYFKNDDADNATIEGVRLRIDLGSPTNTPESYSTVITRVNVCP